MPAQAGIQLIVLWIPEKLDASLRWHDGQLGRRSFSHRRELSANNAERIVRIIANPAKVAMW
jgi:hypothetical protein